MLNKQRSPKKCGGWKGVGGGASPACFPSLSQPFPALPSPSQPHGSVSWSRPCTRGQPSSTRAAREEPLPSSPGFLSMATPQPRASHSSDRPHSSEHSPQHSPTGASPQPGASLPVLSPPPIPNIPASLKHSSSPEQTCSPESLWAALRVPGSIPAVPNTPGSIPVSLETSLQPRASLTAFLQTTWIIPLPGAQPKLTQDSQALLDLQTERFWAGGGVWYFCLSIGFIDFVLYLNPEPGVLLCREQLPLWKLSWFHCKYGKCSFFPQFQVRWGGALSSGGLQQAGLPKAAAGIEIQEERRDTGQASCGSVTDTQPSLGSPAAPLLSPQRGLPAGGWLCLPDPI